MKQLLLVLAFLLSGLLSEQVSAKVVLKSATQIEVNSTYDSLLNPSMKRLLDGLKSRMDPAVSRTIGTVSARLTASKPESTLSNFLADQLLEKARTLTLKKVDISVINIGGIRAAMNKGVLTVGDIYRVAPFEDKVVVLTLTGKDLMSLFQYIARVGGEGLSGARLIVKNEKLIRATIAGESVEDGKTYTVATINYLAQGNGGFAVFLRATETININRTARDCFIEQIEQLTAAGNAISAKLDGRITILK